MKKIVTFLLLTILCLSSFVGCGQTGDEYKNRPKTVKLTYFSSGYGDAWLDAVAKEYMDNYDTETYIDITPTVTPEEDLDKISSGMSKQDLYMLEIHMESVYDKLVDLTDLYSEKPLGEESSNQTIYNKVEKDLYNEYVSRDGKSYTLPYVNHLGYGYAYNKTTLDDAYGEGNYVLPRTTKEFFEMGDYLKDASKNKDGKKKYLFVASFEDDSDYLSYAWKTWFAQLIGLEAYDNYFEGRYFDVTENKYVFDETYPTVVTKYEEETKAWFDIIRTLGLKENGYIHRASDSLSFSTASEVFCGFPLDMQRDPEEVAFTFNGPWLENEVDFLLDEQESYDDPQDIRCIKMPIASEIIKRTPSITTEAMLRDVISYVDGDEDIAPIGVLDEDIEIIREARSFVGAVVTGTCAIPKSASNIEGAKKFLKFLASDKAQLIAQQNIVGGLPLLPYGYVADEDELGFERTEYMKGVLNRAEDSNLIVSSGQQYDFWQYGGFKFPYKSENFLATIFSATADTAMTAAKFYEQTILTYEQKWSTMVRDYKLALGLE